MTAKQRLLLLFLVCSISSFFLLGLHEYVFIRPQSIHQWRQTVGLNITLNFQKQDNGIFQPETNLLNADNYTTGIAQGEFPIFYYAVGKIWKVTGQQEWIFRLITFGIYLAALWVVALFIYEQTKSYFFSIVIPLFFLSVPVLAYYSVSFLMDIVGFSLVILGWFAFYRYANTQKLLWLFAMLMAFLFAGLLKITAQIAVLALAIYCLLGLVNKWEKLKYERKWQLPVLFGIIGITIVQVIWYGWAIHYNNVHNGWYTQNGFYPIWEMTATRWKEIVDWVSSYWYFQYAPKLVYLLFLSMLIYLGIKRVKLPWARFFYVIFFTSAIGTAVYLLLWFQVFHEHDYYIISTYGFVLVATLGSLIFVINHKITAQQNIFFRVLLSCVLIISIYQSSSQLNSRLNGWPNNNGNNKYSSYFDIEPYLREDLGIKRTDKVIAYSDPSVCVSLYLCDQKGWQMNKSDDVGFIKKYNNLGAEFLLVNDSSFYKKERVEELSFKKIGQHKTITIFKIYKNI